MTDDIKQKFYSNIRINPETGCWEWAGLRDKKGYGIFKALGFTHRANRFSWLLHKGEFPNELYVCHKCDNPPCVNPDHLFLGTQKDNMQDMVRKGRNADSKGIKNPRASLYDDAIIQIRKLWDLGESVKEIAIHFCVPKSTVQKIISNETWTHLPPCNRKTSNRGSHLRELDILEMRRLYGLGLSSTLLGKMFRLSQQQAWKVVNYWSFKEVA